MTTTKLFKISFKSASSVSHMNSVPLSQHMSSQSQGQRDYSLLSSQTSPQLGARSAPPQEISGGSHTSLGTENRFHSHQHQSVNQRTPLPIRPSHQFHHAGVGPMTNLQTSQSQYSLSAIHRATQQQIVTNTPFVPPPVQTSGSCVTVASTGDQRGASSAENWRPSGHIRGSLSGREYTEGLNIIQPNQPVQAARPPPVLNTPRPFIPLHLQALMANNMRPQTQTGPGSAAAAGGSTDN